MNKCLRVLLVDDDRQMVKTLADIMRVKGYETTTAFSGEEAVEKARSCGPDCVLMDIKMPGISGIEAFKRIRSFAPALPIALMSAYVTEGQIAEARKEGVDLVLSKPVDILAMLSFLSESAKKCKP